jgi:hypothetical protein
MKHQTTIVALVAFILDLSLTSCIKAQDNKPQECENHKLSHSGENNQHSIPRETDSIIFGWNEIVDRGERIPLDPKSGQTIQWYLHHKKAESDKKNSLSDPGPVKDPSSN